MKKLASLLLVAGFALSVASVNAGENNKSCDKDKKACCKKGEAKSCSKADGKTAKATSTAGQESKK